MSVGAVISPYYDSSVVRVTSQTLMLQTGGNKRDCKSLQKWVSPPSMHSGWWPYFDSPVNIASVWADLP